MNRCQDPLLLSPVQPSISRSKLCGIPDAKEIPVIRVLAESPLSGSHLTEAASALTNKPPGAEPPRGAADRLGRLRDRGAGPGAAANAGGIDTILAGRPGSWEVSVVGDALRAAVGHDERDLWRHRTEPVTVVLNPEHILVDNDRSLLWGMALAGYRPTDGTSLAP